MKSSGPLRMDLSVPLFYWTGHVMRVAVLTAFCVLQWRCLAARGQRGTDAHVFYAVELEGGSKAARALAEQHGLQFISRIGNLEGHFTLRASTMTISPTLEHTLTQHAEVKWLHRQQAHYRDKRATVPAVRNSSQSKFGEFIGQKQSGRGFGKQPPDSLHFNDPLWPMQWELFNYGQVSSVLDLNVMPVWLRNITGNGVVVCIIDDGVDHSNLDLKNNFEAYASFDLRGAHGLSHDPMPLRDNENGHGTKCAGEIAMEANNSYCGVGIAFNARIGGIRLLDGSVTDSMEASALTYNNDFIDIYVCSWGPRDDGTEVAGPAGLTEKALRLGTLKGRDGKGNIFVWASGNGGLLDDHCGADGYVNSIYTIAIGAVGPRGEPATFGEPCPATMAVTPTGSSSFDPVPLVTVSNLGDGCVTHFAGTSSAAPIAAGVLALVLEANPDLSWRDVQHLIASTAKVPDPDQPGWITNGAGYHVHDRSVLVESDCVECVRIKCPIIQTRHAIKGAAASNGKRKFLSLYGFGLLDAAVMVQHARWLPTAAAQKTCEQSLALKPARVLPSGGEVSMNFHSEACRGQHNEVNTLEHVQVTVTMTAVCRGDVSMDLLSPAKTHSVLLKPRSRDASLEGFRTWTMMSVQTWGENPHGTWTLRVKDHKGTVVSCGRSQTEEAAGAILNVSLTLYGTYSPNATQHGPVHGFMALGKLHKVSVTNSFPPQDLIHHSFQLEHARKIGPADIQVAPRHREKATAKRLSAPTLSPGDVDDTDGENLAAHLHNLWNTLRGGTQVSTSHSKALLQDNTPLED